MKSFRKLLGRRQKDRHLAASASESQPQSVPQASQPNQDHTTARQTLIMPDPWESDAAFAAAKAHMSQIASLDPARFRAMMRGGAFNAPLAWLQINYPDCEISDEGPLLSPIPGLDIGPDDTKIFVGRKTDADKTIEVVKLVVIPPEEGEAGPTMPVGGAALGSPAMKAAENALLLLLRQWHADGKLGTCTAMVGMGVDLTLYKFSAEKGFEEPDEEPEVIVQKMRPGT